MGKGKMLVGNGATRVVRRLVRSELPVCERTDWREVCSTPGQCEELVCKYEVTGKCDSTEQGKEQENWSHRGLSSKMP